MGRWSQRRRRGGGGPGPAGPSCTLVTLVTIIDSGTVEVTFGANVTAALFGTDEFQTIPSGASNNSATQFAANVIRFGMNDDVGSDTDWNLNSPSNNLCPDQSGTIT